MQHLHLLSLNSHLMCYTRTHIYVPSIHVTRHSFSENLSCCKRMYTGEHIATCLDGIIHYHVINLYGTWLHNIIRFFMFKVLLYLLHEKV